MKFLDKIINLTKKNIDKNIKNEYKNAIDDITSAAGRGLYETKFKIVMHYENKEEMFQYIRDRLTKEGFNAEIEPYGFNGSYRLLRISWR